MAASVSSTLGARNTAVLNSNGSSVVPVTSFFGTSLRKVNQRVSNSKVSCGKFKVVAEIGEDKQTDKDKWKGLVTDISDDQQDITRGKGMADTLFQAPTGAGTHDAVLSSSVLVFANTISTTM